MAAEDSIPNGEEENEDESNKRAITPPRTLPRNSQINIISPSPPTSHTSWSLVSIKDNQDDDDSSFLIFPPNNHENLHLSPPSPPALDLKQHGKPFELPSLSLSSSSSSSEIVDGDESNDYSSTSTLFSPSTGPDSPPITRARNMVGLARWVNLGVEVLYSRVKGVMSFGSHRIPVNASAFTTAAMVVGFLYFWWRRRRGRIEQRDRDHLVKIIREKDERINQLLNQIARMNDLLMALQRLPASSKT